MSGRSTVKETLSINCTICARTDDATLLNQFIDDVNELFTEWQNKVQITNLNIAVHDNRKYEEVKDQE